MVGWFLCLSVLRASMRSGWRRRSCPLWNPGPCGPPAWLHHGWGAFVIIGCGALGIHRRRGALRRHGSFRPAVDPPGLVWPGHAGARGLNYLGQGALDPREPPQRLRPPVCWMVPAVLMLPMVVLASAATVIASQAVISGFFSIVQPGDADGLSAAVLGGPHVGARARPGVRAEGQPVSVCRRGDAGAAVPLVGQCLPARMASRSAGAMLVDTLLAFYLARHAWRWSRLLAGGGIRAAAGLRCSFFFTGALGKIPDGGWLPLTVGIVGPGHFGDVASGTRHRARVESGTVTNASKPSSAASLPEWPCAGARHVGLSGGEGPALGAGGAGKLLVPLPDAAALGHHPEDREGGRGAHVETHQQAAIHDRATDSGGSSCIMDSWTPVHAARDLHTCLRECRGGSTRDHLTFFIRAQHARSRRPPAAPERGANGCSCGSRTASRRTSIIPASHPSS